MWDAAVVVLPLLAACHALWMASLYRDARRDRHAALSRAASQSAHAGRSPRKLLVALVLTLLEVAAATAIAVELDAPSHYRSMALLLTVPIPIALALFAQSLVLLATDRALRTAGDAAFAILLAMPAFAIVGLYTSALLG